MATSSTMVRPFVLTDVAVEDVNSWPFRCRHTEGTVVGVREKGNRRTEEVFEP